MVKERSTTWEELESLGLSLSKGELLRRKDAKFYQALTKARRRLQVGSDDPTPVDDPNPGG
jgi:hypothetical protein